MDVEIGSKARIPLHIKCMLKIQRNINQGGTNFVPYVVGIFSSFRITEYSYLLI